MCSVMLTSCMCLMSGWVQKYMGDNRDFRTFTSNADLRTFTLTSVTKYGTSGRLGGSVPQLSRYCLIGQTSSLIWPNTLEYVGHVYP